MPTPMKIIIGKSALHAELFDSPCAKQIVDHLIERPRGILNTFSG
jgi:hypothetical protein